MEGMGNRGVSKEGLGGYVVNIEGGEEKGGLVYKRGNNVFVFDERWVNGFPMQERWVEDLLMDERWINGCPMHERWINEFLMDERWINDCPM